MFMTRNESHLKENLGALEIKIGPDDIERLRQKFGDQQPVGSEPLK